MRLFIRTLSISLLCITANAYAIGDTSDHCLLLGSTPSLIIKFAGMPSSQFANPKSSYIHNLKSPLANFTKARPMSGDAYIVFFTPKQSLLDGQIKPGCYTQKSIDELTKEITKSSNVIYAYPNILMKTSSLKKRFFPVGPEQWDMKAPPGGINAEGAYDTNTGSTNAITAVLDTGILHNDSLTPNLITGVTFNNNGSHSIGATPSCGAQCEGYDHGTHVAGTVSASGTVAYGKRIWGVAPTAKIIPVNVFSRFNSDADCGLGGAPCLLSYLSDQINALAWLNGTTFNGLPKPPYITAINMSLGGFGTCQTAFQDQVDNLYAKNISFAIAAGNSDSDASLFSPANCSNVMTIAATGPEGYGAYYTNYGLIVSFAAPGGDQLNYGTIGGIYSTVLDSYEYFQGTSMASPHVAGLSTMLYSIDPSLSSAQIKSFIETNVTTFPSPNPLNTSCTVTKPCGAGIINANNSALDVLSQAPTLLWTPNLIAAPGATYITLSWAPATWSNANPGLIGYTSYVDGVEVGNCYRITATSCTIQNLNPSTAYTLHVESSDARFIYTPPLNSGSLVVSTSSALGPVVTVADRNPFLNTQAFIYYTQLSNIPGSVYHVTRIPGATVQVDTKNKRFIINNILTPEKIENVRIVATSGLEILPSNPVTIPSII